MEIFHFEDLGDTSVVLAANAVVLVLGGYQISIAKNLRGGIYSHLKFEGDRLNTFRVRVLTSSGSTGGGRGGGRGGDAKTIISPNTLFGDIIRSLSLNFIIRILSLHFIIRS